MDPSVPEKWKAAMQPCMEERKKWLLSMMPKGLTVAVAIGPGGTERGLIEFLPIRYAPEPVVAQRSLFINCMWILPPFGRSGVGGALIDHSVRRAGDAGGLTVLAYEGDKWFGFFPYMPASFFRRFGFKECDRDGSRVLLHLDLGGGENPTLIRPVNRQVSPGGKPVVEVLFNSQCPWSGWMAEKALKALSRYDALIRPVNTDDRQSMMEFGLSRGVVVDGVPVISRMSTVKEIEEAVRQVVHLKARRQH